MRFVIIRHNTRTEVRFKSKTGSPLFLNNVILRLKSLEDATF